jgi:hypothetical protein
MKKFVCILVITLLTASAIQISGIGLKNIKFNKDENLNFVYQKTNVFDVPPSMWLKGSDQKQTEDSNYGCIIFPPDLYAQEFKPTKDTLTAVALQMFKVGDPPADLEITVSIRNELNGSDLTSKTKDADIIVRQSDWYLFDFEDITVTPEETYYIVCSEGGGNETNNYCWLFAEDNKYERGIAWYTNDSGETWKDLEDPGGGWNQLDFTFITYFETPKDRSSNNFLLTILSEHLNSFPLLRLLLHQLG